MSFSDVTALTALFLSGIVFYILASRSKGERLTLLGYTLADRKMDHNRFGASFVAGSTSLATVLLFFLSTASFYGFVLLWCGLTYFFGQMIFINYISGKQQLLAKDIRTVSDLWFTCIESSLISRIITAVTISSFLIILFVELYIGSVIVTYFLKPFLPNLSGVLGFAFVSILVISYVRIGGLRAVMETDRWQLKLLVTSVVALFVFSVLVPEGAEPLREVQHRNIFDVDASLTDCICFCIWILVLNFTLPFSQLSSWQRIAAAESGSAAKEGFNTHRRRLLFVWIVPVISFVLLASKGFGFKDVTGLFDSMKNAGGLSSGVLYPLVVLGFGAALFSTADTALIAFGTSLADKNTFVSRLETYSEKKLKRSFTIFAAITFCLLAIIYYLAEADIGSWFIPLVYAIFGQLTVVSPLIIYCLAKADRPRRKLTVLGEILVAGGIFLSWALIISCVFIDVSRNTQRYSQGAAVISFLIAGAFLLLGIKFGTKPKAPGVGWEVYGH